jgi:tRNA-splicing ligase RtcB (3'-phosphate/5'-hydroxy nucleic acid ligase)
MTMSNFETMQHGAGVPVRMWTKGVPVEAEAREQLAKLASLPVVAPFVAVMPDVHVGIGATVGSVVPTRHAIIPAAVGVDIGCGMIAARTSLSASDLPESLSGLRMAIEAAVPHGRTSGKGRDKGAWGQSASAPA